MMQSRAQNNATIHEIIAVSSTASRIMREAVEDTAIISWIITVLFLARSIEGLAVHAY